MQCPCCLWQAILAPSACPHTCDIGPILNRLLQYRYVIRTAPSTGAQLICRCCMAALADCLEPRPAAALNSVAIKFSECPMSVCTLKIAAGASVAGAGVQLPLAAGCGVQCCSRVCCSGAVQPHNCTGPLWTAACPCEARLCWYDLLGCRMPDVTCRTCQESSLEWRLQRCLHWPVHRDCGMPFWPGSSPARYASSSSALTNRPLMPAQQNKQSNITMMFMTPRLGKRLHL